MKFSFLPLLALVFITLKLVGTISWSWWWVLLPLYGPLALILIGLIAIYAFDRLSTLIPSKKK